MKLKERSPGVFILLIVVLSQQLSHSQGLTDSIGNRIVEEGEIQRIKMADHFTGNLLDIQLSIENKTDYVRLEVTDMIKMQAPLKSYSSQFISDTSFGNIRLDSWPRSSVIFEYREKKKIRVYPVMAMITRDMRFIGYNMSSLKDSGTVSKMFEIQLNKTYISADCQDLIYYQQSQDFRYQFLFFCHYQQPVQDNPKKVEGEFTIFYIKYNYDLDKSKPLVVVQYSTSDIRLKPYYNLPYDTVLEPIYSAIDRNMDKRTYNQLYFMAKLVSYDVTDPRLQILRLNVTVLKDLSLQGINYTYSQEPILVFHQKFVISNRPSEFYPLESVIQLSRNLSNSDYSYFAINYQGLSVLICKIYKYHIGSFNVPFILCNYQQSQELPLSRYEIVQLYQAPLTTFDVESQRTHFYGICTSPAAVLEFDYSNIDNVIITKIFQVNLPNDRVFGHLSIAVNNNYLLHLVESPDNGQQYIRVFVRNSSLFSMARFDIPIPKITRASSFIFPNTFFNYIVFRDERSVNVSEIVEWTLILNGTNRTLIDQFKNQAIQIQITAQNRYVGYSQRPKINFVDKYNTSILTLTDSTKRTEIPVLYNCGENSMNYIVNDYLTGPNFNLSRMGQKEQNYFILENQGLTEYFKTSEIPVGEKCKVNFWFAYEGYKDKEGKGFLADDEYVPMVLVCIQQENSVITSYILKDNDQVLKQNEIIMTQVTFVDFSYDVEQRTIIALAENPGYPIRRNPLSITNRYELHLFKVQNEVIWVKLIQIVKPSNVTFLSYSQNLRTLMFVEYRQQDLSGGTRIFETISAYSFNQSTTFLNKEDQQTPEILTVWENRTIRAIQSSDHAIFSMTADQRLAVHQISGNRISTIRTLKYENLISFDIFEDKYFVVYSGDNTIEIYRIEQYLTLNYRMRIPLYKDYENFKFRYTNLNNQFKQVARTYNQDFMGFLATNQTHTMVFIYALYVRQAHNSMVFARDVTQQFGSTEDPGEYIRVYITGDIDTITTLATASSNEIRLYEALYFNRLSLNQTLLPSLVDKCKNYLPPDDSIYVQKADTWAVDVENITVQANSLFPSNEDPTDMANVFNLRVQSANKGSAVVSKLQSKNDTIKIIVQGDSPKTAEPYQLLYETYMLGHNLKFKTNCHYISPNGTQASCQDALVEEVKDVPYSFPIEFVTGQRKIKYQFTMGQMFFMLDEYGSIIIQRLPLYSQILDSVDNQALITLMTISQQEVFQCNISGFIDFFELTDYMKNETDQPHRNYIIVYQCDDGRSSQGLSLDFVLITTYDIPDKVEYENLKNNTPPFNFYKYKTNVQVPYQIIDIQMLNPQVSDLGIISFLMPLTLKIPDGFSNLLTLYKVEINPQKKLMGVSDVDSISGTVLSKDSFQATKMLGVPNSGILAVVLEDEGALLLNISSLAYDRIDQKAPPLDRYLLQTIKFEDKLKFASQLYYQKGDLVVYSVMGNWPNTLIFLTNYGLVIFEFPYSLANATLEQIKQSKKINARIIPFDFSQFDGKIVQNPYGSAFLFRRYDLAENFETYLAAISFYSAPNSQVFKIINVASNEKCFALNQNSYFEFTPEDQIAVSFVCNDQFRIFRVCMRPHVVVDLQKFSQNATYLDEITGREHGAYSFNQFFLEVEATQKDFNNTYRLRVNVEFQDKVDNKLNLTLGAILVGLTLLWFLVFFASQSCCNKDDDQKDKQEEEKNIKLGSSRSVRQSAMTSFRLTNYIPLTTEIQEYESPKVKRNDSILEQAKQFQAQKMQTKIQDDSFISDANTSHERELNLLLTSDERQWNHRPTSRFGEYNNNSQA